MKKNLTFLAMLFSFAIVQGQNMLVINLNGNPSEKIPFSNIQKITFDADNMLLKTAYGTNRYLLDNIASITFLNETGIKDFTEKIEVNIFINASGEIVVESPHQINQLVVFDLTGRQVALSTQNKMNVNHLNTEIYILQVVTEKGIVSKKFIKNN